MANSYNTSALSNYVEQKNEKLIAKTVLGAKTADMLTLQTGVAGPTALNLIGSEIVLQADACGWNEAGSVSLSQRILTPKGLRVNMAICDKNLLGKWAGYLVRVAANKTDADLPFEEEFVNEVINGVNDQVEKMIWFGNSSSTTEFDGFVTLAEATGSGVTAIDNTHATSAYAFIKNVYMSIPAHIASKDDCKIFVGPNLFREFIQDLVTANLYHFDPRNNGESYILPGTNVEVVMVPGLAVLASHEYEYAFAGRLSNMFYGVNLEGGEEIFDVWYSKDNREFRFAIEFMSGVQFAYGNECVIGRRALEDEE